MGRRRRGPMSAIIGILTTLIVVGLILAVITQFDGDLGEMIQWLLSGAWNIVTSVRDTVLGWDTFQGLF